MNNDSPVSILLRLMAMLCALFPASLFAREVRVSAPTATYIGVETSGTSAFRGIRYGTDTGVRRFQAPLAAPDSATPLLALAFAPACPQSGTRYQPQSEDCLFLNVWAPAASPRKSRPVMVYFHGGAYASGSVTDPLNDGKNLSARGDVVVVTVNHRLNAFGYLSLPDRFPDSGNAGQLDLILALTWVQRNVASFGGDPRNVTVFGQSGGGAKIATLMAMPAARGLFHKAITMSGQQVTASGPNNAAKRAAAFLETLGVDPATASTAQIVAALSAVDPILGGGMYMGPVLDTVNLPRHPFHPDAVPQSLHIPMMLGNTISETRAFFGPDHPKIRGLTWENIAVRMAPELRIDIDAKWVISQFRARYPGYTPTDLFYAATTTARSWRGQIIEAEERAKAGAPAYVYQLDFEDAKHTDDIALVFGTVRNATPAQTAMSDRMMDVFVTFARTGKPGWPAYDMAKRRTMIFDTRSRVVENPRDWERELFGRVPYVQPGN